MPGEEKGLCYWFLSQEKRSLLPEKLRGGNKNVSPDAGFKDPVALRVRKTLLFGKYPLYWSVANMYLLLAILFPF